MGRPLICLAGANRSAIEGIAVGSDGLAVRVGGEGRLDRRAPLRGEQSSACTLREETTRRAATVEARTR